MSTKPEHPAAKPPAASSAQPAQERYMPGDPIPVPDATEANTESSWALFSDVKRQPDPEFLDTVPASLLDEDMVAGIAPKNKTE